MNRFYRRFALVSCLLVVLFFVPRALTAQSPDKDVPSPTPAISEAMIAQKIAWYQSDLAASAEMAALLPGAEHSPDDLAPYSAMTFQSGRNGNWDIYLATNTVGSLTRLTTSTKPDLRPQIRRGADIIVFTRAASNTNYEIYRVNADGSGETRLTETEATDHYPTWSPDGAWIYFASNRTGNYELFRMDIHGGALQQLTNNGLIDRAPSLSPDGSKMVWVRVVSSSEGQLMIANSDGTGEYAATAPITLLQNPVWSPDGAKILFDGDVTGDFWSDLTMLDPANGAVTALYGGSYLVDIWAGSWGSRGSSAPYYVRLQYELVGNTLYVDSLTIWQWATGAPLIDSGGLDYNPAVTTTDITLPAAALALLPAHSQAQGVELEWSGQDAGPAPIVRYDIQSREPAGQGEWVLHTSITDPEQQRLRYLGGSLNRVVEFRIRGVDAAENEGAWSTPVSTRLYSRWVDVSVRDSRGRFLPGTTMTVVPAAVATIPQGEYRTRVYQSGAEESDITLAAAGWAAIPPATRTSRFDTFYEAYLPEADNLFSNGDFENGLTGWTSTGEVSATTQIRTGHTGDYAVRVGGGCGRCWNSLEVLDTEHTSFGYSSFGAALAPNGTLHLAYRNQTDGRVYYRQRPFGGEWSTSVFLVEADYFTHSGDIPPIAFARSSDGRLHLTYPRGGNIVYIGRDSNGIWSTPVTLGANYSLYAPTNQLVSDGRGGVYAMYITADSESIRLEVRQRQSDGVWQAPFTVDASGARENGENQIIAMADGTLHVVYREWGGVTLLHRSRTPQGEWSSENAIFPERSMINTQPYPHDLLVDASGQLHAILGIYGQESVLFYSRYLPASNSWTIPDTIMPPALAQNRSTQAITLFNGPNDEVYLYIATLDGTGIDWVYRRRANGTWDEPYGLPQDTPNTERLDVFYTPTFGWQAMAHSLVPSVGFHIVHREWLLAESNSTLELRRTVTIPAAMPAPTLSWMMDVPRALPGGESLLTVHVQDSVTTTTVYTVTATSPGWELHWADLSAWAGETVTVTFALNQSAGEPWLFPRLDDIALAGYRTPFITQVSPSVIPANWTGAAVTVTGQSFTAPVIVKVNGISATTNRLDDQTLEITLPAGLRPGAVLLVIQNGAGRTGSYYGLRLGVGRFLPLMQR